jgi:pyruvate dehydrogenase E2 component (dihydrolipoamide acetyltransferase)
MASEKGIDISSVKGSGDNGRIVKKDIENYQPTAVIAAKRRNLFLLLLHKLP